MRFSQILLDLDTGDASMHNVNAKFAAGRVDVASMMYEYASLLADAENSVIQEAAEAAEASGLPTDPAEAPGLASEAVAQELIGIYDVLVENARKVKAAADRDMKAIIGLGKKYGISTSAANSGNFMISFARPLGKALVREFAANRKVGNKIKFSVPFPTESGAENLIFNYGNAMAHLAAVFGLSIGDCIEDPTVQEVLSLDKNFVKTMKAWGSRFVGGDPTAVNDPKTGFSKGGVPDAAALYKALQKGTNVKPLGKITTTKSADADDIAWLITYTYVARQISDGIVKSATATKKSGAEQNIRALCDSESRRHAASEDRAAKKISKNFDKINANAKEWAGSIERSSDMVVKTFSDAVAALGHVATGTGDVADTGEEAAAAEE